MNDLEKLLVARSLKDAKAKVDALPGRLKDEFQQAEAEGREPFPITPLTGIRADLLVACCEVAAKVSGLKPEVQDWVGSQRRCCSKLGQAEVFLLSEQLLAILTAAGVKEDKAPKGE